MLVFMAAMSAHFLAARRFGPLGALAALIAIVRKVATTPLASQGESEGAKMRLANEKQ